MKTTYDRPFPTNVHAIVTYIQYYSYKITDVKYCPICNMPEFSNLVYNGTVYCRTCHEWIKRPNLLEIDPMNYLDLIMNLPLRYGGYSWESNKEKYLEYKEPSSPTRCYNDLEPEELLYLDSRL